MSGEKDSTPATPRKVSFSTLVAALLAGLVVISIVFYVLSPLEPWVTFLILAGLWVAELLAIWLMYIQFRKMGVLDSTKTASRGLVWSGFGEQRPSIGSKPPSKRR